MAGDEQVHVCDWLEKEPDDPGDLWLWLLWDLHWWHLECGVNSYRFVHGYDERYLQVRCAVETVFSLARSKLSQDGTLYHEVADWVVRLCDARADFTDLIVENETATDIRVYEPKDEEEMLLVPERFDTLKVGMAELNVDLEGIHVD